MAIPTQTEMFQFVLETMATYPQFSRREAKDAVCQKLRLTDAERHQMTSTDVPIYESRTGWAISWLCDVGYIARVGRGTYVITEDGKRALQEKLTASVFAKRLYEGRKNRAQSGNVQPVELEDGMRDTSPMERIDAIVAEMHGQLSNEIMEAILSVEGRAGDAFFERIVTELLEKMGYGKGMVTAATNDGGIDGIIKTDPLGFNPILIQAKRYAPDRCVGRPEIQAFAGALGAVTRGAFITTSYFSQVAVDFARSYPHADIVLIDGKKLTGLMIQYNLGVSVERDISIKRIDGDYFEQ